MDALYGMINDTLLCDGWMAIILISWYVLTMYRLYHVLVHDIKCGY